MDWYQPGGRRGVHRIWHLFGTYGGRPPRYVHRLSAPKFLIWAGSGVAHLGSRDRRTAPRECTGCGGACRDRAFACSQEAAAELWLDKSRKVSSPGVDDAQFHFVIWAQASRNYAQLAAEARQMFSGLRSAGHEQLARLYDSLAAGSSTRMDPREPE